MPTRHEIRCINKTDRLDPHDRIKHVGGVNADSTRWKITQQAAVEGIEERKWSFYVTRNGRTVDVIVAVSRLGTNISRPRPTGISRTTCSRCPSARRRVGRLSLCRQIFQLQGRGCSVGRAGMTV